MCYKFRDVGERTVYFRKEGPKIDTAKFTVLIKNSISCPDLDEDFSV